MAREADEIVQRLKEKAEQQVNQILNQTSFSSLENNNASANSPLLSDAKIANASENVRTEVKQSVAEEESPKKVESLVITPNSTPSPQPQSPPSDNNNNKISSEQEKLIQPQKTKKTKAKCGCVLS